MKVSFGYFMTTTSFGILLDYIEWDHWDQISLGIAGIGIDPNLMKNKGLGSVPKSYVCDDCDHSKTSIILSSQNYQYAHLCQTKQKSSAYSVQKHKHKN